MLLFFQSCKDIIIFYTTYVPTESRVLQRITTNSSFSKRYIRIILPQRFYVLPSKSWNGNTFFDKNYKVL